MGLLFWHFLTIILLQFTGVRNQILRLNILLVIYYSVEVTPKLSGLK